MKTLILKYGRALGFLWVETFDRSLFIYNIIKNLNIVMRYLFYISLTLVLYFSMETFDSVIDIKIFDFPLYLENLLILLAYVCKVLALLFTIGIFSYENLIKIDVEEHLKQKKNEKFRRKQNKLQWWRLRNMNLFLRVLFYLWIYFCLYLILEDILISSFYKVYITPTKTQFLYFLHDFDFFMKCYTTIFLGEILILDYFLRKKKTVSDGNSNLFPTETNNKNLDKKD